MIEISVVLPKLMLEVTCAERVSVRCLAIPFRTCDDIIQGRPRNDSFLLVLFFKPDFHFYFSGLLKASISFGIDDGV